MIYGVEMFAALAAADLIIGSPTEIKQEEQLEWCLSQAFTFGPVIAAAEKRW